ncbi:YoaK family protein [uncultured Tyzzerella sp.]|uniref:YoaK family protein n=1 Tax=uncultured Tyzzerella sp. TaxID=2321398 RepID=UPI002942533C|nr:YoaK family protein [uncultured Tyzzerella sp.]
MSNNKLNNVEENIYISLILTFIGGFLDSYTYILYDKIWANTQTGNLILFSLFLVEGQFYNAFLRIFPIASFCIAIFINQALIYKFSKNKNWIKIVLAISIVSTSMLGFGIFKNNNIVVICLISFVCALMIGTFKKSKGDIFAPIMCTGNLRSLVEFFAKWIIYKEKDAKKVVLKYVSIIVIFCTGVYLGAIIVIHLATYSMLVCTVLFLVSLIIVIYKQ